jgi:hypothetical protein
LDFKDLINTSLDAISFRIKAPAKRDMSIPKLDFSNVKEFKEQDWLSYS